MHIAKWVKCTRVLFKAYMLLEFMKKIEPCVEFSTRLRGDEEIDVVASDYKVCSCCNRVSRWSELFCASCYQSQWITKPFEVLLVQQYQERVEAEAKERAKRAARAELMRKPKSERQIFIVSLFRDVARLTPEMLAKELVGASHWPTKMRSAQTSLRRMAKNGTITKVKRGVYAPP